jgi:hypothetical protein
MSRKPVFFLIGFFVGAVVSLLWNAMPIIRAGAAPSAVRPVYPKQQTFLDPVGTSHLCKKRTLPLLFRYL